MSDTFKDKVAVITGGAQGLGAALAKELIAVGATVVVADIHLEQAKAVAAGLGERAHAVALDVANPEQTAMVVQQVKSRFGTLDLYFNNAGILIYGEACDVAFSDWQRLLGINLMGVVAGSLFAYRVMKEQRSGRIVNIASASVFTCDPLFAPYVTSKYGVLGFSRVLAMEAEAYNVGVSVVCPGNIRTPMLDDKEPSWLTPAIPVERAARNILRGVAAKRKIIVFPLRWRLIWWADRLSPHLLNPLRRVIVRRAQARKKEA
jgi:NAD(P)-dependent dehydrogenase (short-subunit alcohol dehydrogenase family)